MFSAAHVYTVWPTEPEGLLSTPSAVVSVLLGCWTGMAVAGRTPSPRLGGRIIGAGALCAAVGWGLSPILPMVKMIWTPTFVLFTGGWAMIAFGVCYLLVDVRHVANPVWPVQVFGRNSILAYVLSELAAIALSMVTVHGVPFSVFRHDVAGRCGRRTPVTGTGVARVRLPVHTVDLAALYVPYRRRWFVRV